MTLLYTMQAMLAINYTVYLKNHVRKTTIRTSATYDIIDGEQILLSGLYIITREYI